MKIRKRIWNIIAGFGIVAAVPLLCLPTTAYAQTTMDAALGGNTSSPVLTVTNSTDAACQLLPIALGTVGITEVTQQGQVIAPVLIDTSNGEALDITLAQQWQTVQPGDSFDIPLRTFEAKDGIGLESYTWSSNGGSYVLAYELKNAPYTATLNYSLPIEPTDGAPACPNAATMATIGGGQPWLLPAGIGVVVLAAAVLVVIWFVKRKRPKAGAAAVIAIGAVGLLWVAAPVRAEYIVPSVPESAQRQFNTCMDTFARHGGITNDIVNFFRGSDRPNIRIVPNTEAHSDAADYRGVDNSIHVYWDYTTPRYNPHDRVPSDPCANLYHELTHAYNIHHDTNDRRFCGDSGVPIAEVLATREENRLRAAMGLAQRTHYGHNRIPTGDCPNPEPGDREPEVPPCEGGDEACAETNGDPHLRTFDGLRYDFQAAGEFVAVQGKDDQFVVQVRQVPWHTSRLAAVNQSVAMQVGGDQVEIMMRGYKPRLLINSKEAEIKNHTLPGGGSLTAQRKYIQVTWPDGSRVYLRTIGSFGLHTVVKPSAKHKGSLQGVLGNADGDPANDLRIRDGDKTIEPKFEQLYPAYADSWRVTSESSLFTYDAGESTETYTDRTFPDAELTAANVPGSAAAGALCRRLGVTQPDILRDCIVDVAVTGRPEFAHTAQQGQATTAIADYGGQLWHVNVAEPGASPSVSFTAKAGEKVFIDAYNTTLPDQCGVLILRGPNGAVGSGCIHKGRGSIDGVVLPDAGTYTLTVDPSGDATGRISLVRIPIQDQSGTIQIDGLAAVAAIERPGAVARFSFAGRAGQRVFVDASDSTLVSQCGLLVLRNASRPLASGCVDGSTGYIDTVELPEDGTYTIVVDPSSRHTGSLKLNVIDAPQVTRDIAINGSPAEATIDRYGSRAIFSFQGKAGQRIYATIQSTITSQCGVIVLRDPDGSPIGSGCIFNGSGELNSSGIVLPKTGNYKLIIDPTRRTTGTATVTIHD